MTVEECQTRMSVQEFFEWAAYFQLEPWGEVRADFRAGITSAVIANANRAKGTKAFTPVDFMPFVKAGPTQMKSADIKSALNTFAAISNRRFKDGNNSRA